MNGRALNDRAIEVSPSSSRVSDLCQQDTMAKSVLTLSRYSIALLDLSRWVAHPFSPRFHHLRIVRDLEIGHVHRAASVISSDERPASGVRIRRLVNRWTRIVKVMVRYRGVSRSTTRY